ncbi:MAG: sigma factor AlgU regulator MucB [Wenzhouxiangellaceae bacterium]
MLATGLLMSVVAGRAQEAGDWLVRMDHALSSLSYRGVLVSVGPGRFESYKVVHRVDDGVIRERLIALDGPEREVLRENDRVQCLISGQHTLVLSNPWPVRLLARVPLSRALTAGSVYRASVGGTGRVAGRDARLIEIQPQDRFRYGRRLWLDEDTGMLLRAVVFDPAGEVVEQLSFVAIEIGVAIADAELDSELTEPAAIARYTLPEMAEKTVLGPAPEGLRELLPPGFELASVGRGDRNNPFEHLLFSDGLSSFSIYIEPGTQSSLNEYLESRGAMHIYTGRLDDRVVTVLGEVPAQTVRMVGHRILRERYPAFRHLE